jgi:hypothetical protein
MAPNGLVVGIDLGVTLRIAAARGYDLAVLSELLPIGERGVVDAIAEQIGKQ